MKKRIGTRNYDTDASRKIATNAGMTLYQKKTREMEFFLVDKDGKIIHMSDDDAKQFCDISGTRIISNPQYVRALGRNGAYTVIVDEETHREIMLYADGKMTAGEAVKEMLTKGGWM